MISFDNIITYLHKNKEWLFSGIGVTILGILRYFYVSNKKSKDFTINSPTQSGFINIQTSSNEANQFYSMAIAIFENNFPRLVNKTYEKVLENRNSFIELVLEGLKDKNKDLIANNIENPDFQYILNKALTTASRTQNKTTHLILSQLILERCLTNNENLESLIYNESILTIEKLNSEHFNLIALIFLLVHTIEDVSSLDKFIEYISINHIPLLTKTNLTASIAHLKYSGIIQSANKTDLYKHLLYNFPKAFIKNSEILIEPTKEKYQHINLEPLSNDVMEKLFHTISHNKYKFKIKSLKEFYQIVKEYKINEMQAHFIENDFLRMFYSREELDEIFHNRIIKYSELNLLWNRYIADISLTSVGQCIGLISCEIRLGINFKKELWLSD